MTRALSQGSRPAAPQPAPSGDPAPPAARTLARPTGSPAGTADAASLADLAQVGEAELLATLAGGPGGRPAASRVAPGAPGAPGAPRLSPDDRGVLGGGAGLPWLSRASPRELCAARGWSPEGAARVWAAFELGRRAEHARMPPRAPITGAAGAAALLAPLLRGRREECLALGLLDARHRLLSTLLVGQGTLDRSLVHPREIFAPALREGAAAVLCAHNHPSGDPEPSAQDWAVTRRLRTAGELLGVPLLDHLVIGAGCWISLRARDTEGLFAGPLARDRASNPGWLDPSARPLDAT